MSIEVKNISCLYSEKTSLEVKALDNISFRINDGEFVGIMGHTGCGKSTLIQLIAGLLTPTSGQIIIDGADINAADYDRSILRRTIGIVFQHPEYQLFETTVAKDVSFALKHSRLSKAEKEERIKWVLETLGFSYHDIKNKSPLSLSGGEKRRIAIAGVLVAKPKILIFDEPIAGLDPYGRREFLELVTELNQAGITILMVSHNSDVLCEFAHRILVLDHGKLVADNSPANVFYNLEQASSMHIGVSNVRSIAQGLYEKGILPTPVITRYQTLIENLTEHLKVREPS